MALFTKEFSITSTTPSKILSSALVKRHVFLDATAGMLVGASNAGSPDGVRLANGGRLDFVLATGDELWAWADSGSSGTIQVLTTTELL